jgi:hypothetical protein
MQQRPSRQRLSSNTGHIMCFYEKVKKVKADVAAVLV